MEEGHRSLSSSSESSDSSLPWHQENPSGSGEFVSEGDVTLGSNNRPTPQDVPTKSMRVQSLLFSPTPYFKPSSDVNHVVFKSFQAPESPRAEKMFPGFGKPPIAPKPVFLRAKSADSA